MKIGLLAGEASGDLLGGALMREMPDDKFVGIGGETMIAAGLKTLFPMQELSVMGFSEVIKNYFSLRKRLNETVDYFIKENPSVIILIDAQGFCDRVAKGIRKASPHIKLVKYVAPTVWAWRPSRAAKIKPLYDEVFALFPFEPEVMARLNGPKTTYIGHPLMASIPENLATDRPYALILPGSRSREITYHLPIFMEAIQNFPTYHWILPTTSHLEARIKSEIMPYKIKPLVVTNDKSQYFEMAHVALAASGTVTLELALHGVPTIAAYKGNALEAAIMKKLVKIPSILLPNIIIGEKIMPEFIQEQVTVEGLTKSLLSLDRQKQAQGFKKLREIMRLDKSSSAQAAKRITGITHGD